VASQANHQFKVAKIKQQNHTQTTVNDLSEAERIEEIARMLGGIKITEQTRQHAKEMLALDGQAPL
jgi:DNA repair protein RecN (Recombination protein N)